MNLQAGETSHFSPTMMSCQKAPPLIPRKIQEIGKAFLMLSTENTGRYKLMGVGKYLQHILDIYACLPLQASQTFFGDSFMILCSFFGIFYAILCQFQQNFMPFYAHFTENFMLSNECFPSLNIRSSMKYQIPFRFLPSFPLFL